MRTASRHPPGWGAPLVILLTTFGLGWLAALTRDAVVAGVVCVGALAIVATIATLHRHTLLRSIASSCFGVALLTSLVEPWILLGVPRSRIVPVVIFMIAAALVLTDSLRRRRTPAGLTRAGYHFTNVDTVSVIAESGNIVAGDLIFAVYFPSGVVMALSLAGAAFAWWRPSPTEAPAIVMRGHLNGLPARCHATVAVADCEKRVGCEEKSFVLPLHSLCVGDPLVVRVRIDGYETFVAEPIPLDDVLVGRIEIPWSAPLVPREDGAAPNDMNTGTLEPAETIQVEVLRGISGVLAGALIRGADVDLEALIADDDSVVIVTRSAGPSAHQGWLVGHRKDLERMTWRPARVEHAERAMLAMKLTRAQLGSVASVLPKFPKLRSAARTRYMSAAQDSIGAAKLATRKHSECTHLRAALDVLGDSEKLDLSDQRMTTTRRSVSLWYSQSHCTE